MKKIVITAMLLMAMMMISLCVLAENAPGSTPPPSTITVTVLSQGTNCPHNGVVESNWKWVKLGDPTDIWWKQGTSATYTNPPKTVVLQSIDIGVLWYFTKQVKVTVKPTGHGGTTVTVDEPFNSVGITPSCICYNCEKDIPATTE